MTNLANGESNQILLLAPKLLGESLALQLAIAAPELEFRLKEDSLKRHPCLVIWSVESLENPGAIQLELKYLQEYWQPAPVLLILPAKLRLKTTEFLQFDCPGLLQDPDLKTLRESIKTLIGGGRVIKLKEQSADTQFNNQSAIGIGQWFLISGIQQINDELQRIELSLTSAPQNTIKEIILFGRKKELRAAKNFLYWIWGPLKVSIEPLESKRNSINISSPRIGSIGYPLQEGFETDISLSKRDAMSVWLAIRSRLENTIKKGLINSTGSILAIEGLSDARQKDLLMGLIKQFDQVLQKLRNSKKTQKDYRKIWDELQLELRRNALQQMAGSYVRLPFDGELKPVGEHLLSMAELLDNDDELPDASHMLDPLLLNKPLIVDGQLLPADDPRALIKLEMFISNWLIRISEIISAEVISVCGQWPELRGYLLNTEFLSTRELERLRNQLNSQNRWQTLIERPIQLYESKRLFYILSKGKIEPLLITEPRDKELRQLDWWQQQVALLVEARDAIAPQLQGLVKKFGDLMVILLTQVVGRSIGLIGRGIAQGMGRSLRRN